MKSSSNGNGSSGKGLGPSPLQRSRKSFALIIYVLQDLLTAALSWGLFFLYRRRVVDGFSVNWPDISSDPKFYMGMLLIPLGWLFLYWLSGSYSDVFRKSRLAEAGRSFMATVIGTTFIFFGLLLDDQVDSYRDYYLSFLGLFGIHFLVVLVSRLIYLTRARARVLAGKVSYETLMIGGRQRALDLYHEIQRDSQALGFRFRGFIDVDSQDSGNGAYALGEVLPRLGGVKDLRQVFDKHTIEEVIIAVEDPEHDVLEEILNVLATREAIVRIRADVYDIISGSVRMKNVHGAILIELYPEMMPRWQRVIKRMIDIAAALLVLLLGWWIFLICAIRVRQSSSGPIFYTQERLGLHRKPFPIYKFRSMRTDAEADGPALSKGDDARITAWGKVMRKWRLDELPQVYNILRGDMSLVGPRPERQFFYEKLVREAPAYRHLHKVRPGLTSWGMVKYGYASSTDEMIERMKYDLLYIENMSLAIDFKIIGYTILVVSQGRGK